MTLNFFERINSASDFDENLMKKLKVLLKILENLFKIRNSLIKEKIKLYIKKWLKNNE